MSAAAVAIADLLLSAGINYLIQSQQVQATIATARAQGREVTAEELAAIKYERDKMALEVDMLLDKAARDGG